MPNTTSSRIAYLLELVGNDESKLNAPFKKALEAEINKQTPKTIKATKLPKEKKPSTKSPKIKIVPSKDEMDAFTDLSKMDKVDVEVALSQTGLEILKSYATICGATVSAKSSTKTLTVSILKKIKKYRELTHE